jgi:glycosyltransferase involved in cell wall biosynthesis
MPKKLLFVVYRLPGSGSEKVTLNVMRGLDRTKFDSSLLVLRGDESSWDELLNGVKISAVLSRGPLRRQRLRMAWKMIRLCVSQDLLVGTVEGSSTIVPFIAALLARRRFLGIVQCEPSWIFNGPARRLAWISKLLYRRTKRLVFVSQSGREDMRRWLGFQESPKGWSVILNAFDRSSYPEGSLADSAPALWPHDDVPTVLAAGKLEHRKGFDILIRAHAKLAESGAPLRLVILGEGHLRKDLEDLVRRLGVENTVSMPGYVSNVLPYMRRASVYVLSSYGGESFPMVLIEAMACGLPVVAVDSSPGNREVLDGGRCGLMSPPGDPEALAQAVKTILTNAALRDHYRQQGINRVRDLQPEKINSQWNQLLSEFLRC